MAPGRDRDGAPGASDTCPPRTISLRWGRFRVFQAPMSASSIDNFLGSGDTLARLQAHAGRLLRLQQQLGELLPDYLADACRVANLKGEDLVIHVESAGLAVKLRQAVPSLLADFARAGVILRDIKVKVAVRRIPARATASTPSARERLDALRPGSPGGQPAGRLPAGHGPQALREAGRLDEGHEDALDDEQRKKHQCNDDGIAEQAPPQRQIATVPGEHKGEQQTGLCRSPRVPQRGAGSARAQTQTAASANSRATAGGVLASSSKVTISQAVLSSRSTLRIWLLSA
jgi:hypothetical protein